jgi:hypothetical protein
VAADAEDAQWATHRILRSCYRSAGRLLARARLDPAGRVHYDSIGDGILQRHCASAVC